MVHIRYKFGDTSNILPHFFMRRDHDADFVNVVAESFTPLQNYLSELRSLITNSVFICHQKVFLM